MESREDAIARCPACGLSLPDEPDQRDKRCPECLRTNGVGVIMEVRPEEPVAHAVSALA